MCLHGFGKHTAIGTSPRNFCNWVPHPAPFDVSARLPPPEERQQKKDRTQIKPRGGFKDCLEPDRTVASKKRLAQFSQI